MGGFKTTLINCQQCGRRIMVRAADAERGSILCSHVGCGAVNTLTAGFTYDDAIVRGLPEFGKLTYLANPKLTYPLRFGENVIGTSDTCSVQVGRFMHDGRCFISRRHCTITVAFDPWTGQLRYQLQDGAVTGTDQPRQSSLNGTLLKGVRLQPTEIIGIDNEGVFTLGGIDQFRLSQYIVPVPMLETYKVSLDFNPDLTQ